MSEYSRDRCGMKSCRSLMPYFCLRRPAALSSPASLWHKMKTHWWYVVLADGLSNLMRKSCALSCSVWELLEST